jgi:hypothetical protein
MIPRIKMKTSIKMENQGKSSEEQDLSNDSGFDSRNQYSGSGDFSPDELEGPYKEEDGESSESGNNVETDFPNELDQDDSGHSKSDIDPEFNGQ